MSETPKPCPFCGSAATIRSYRTAISIACGNTDCPAAPSTAWLHREDAIRRWNTRQGEER